MLTWSDLNIERIPVDPEKVLKYKAEDDFTSLAVDLFNETWRITAVLACASHLDSANNPRSCTRDEAILNGLIVRIYKLQEAILDQTCQKRSEIVGIMTRCLGESCINLLYLLQHQSADSFHEFVEYSLREEKRLLDSIQQNIKERGYEIPIEVRMRSSIERSVEESGIPIEDINDTSRSPWGKSIWKRVAAIGWDELYQPLFGLPSHAVHGNWQDLLTHHLIKEGSGFRPAPWYSTPRPQYLFALGLITAKVNLSYLDYLVPSCDDKERMRGRLAELIRRLTKADELHEDFLCRTNSS